MWGDVRGGVGLEAGGASARLAVALWVWLRAWLDPGKGVWCWSRWEIKACVGQRWLGGSTGGSIEAPGAAPGAGAFDIHPRELLWEARGAGWALVISTVCSGGTPGCPRPTLCPLGCSKKTGWVPSNRVVNFKFLFIFIFLEKVAASVVAEVLLQVTQGLWGPPAAQGSQTRERCPGGSESCDIRHLVTKTFNLYTL